jgi:hypothetical protein
VAGWSLEAAIRIVIDGASDQVAGMS